MLIYIMYQINELFKDIKKIFLQNFAVAKIPFYQNLSLLQNYTSPNEKIFYPFKEVVKYKYIFFQ